VNLARRVATRSVDVTGPLVVVLIGAVLPWGRSGTADRSSFELVRVARRLEVLDGAAATVAVLWLALPVVTAVVAIAGASGRRGLAAALGATAAVSTVALAIAVLRSPLIARPGIAVSCVGAGLLLVALAVGAASRRVGTDGSHPREPGRP
jgi:hypothetical protein